MSIPGTQGQQLRNNPFFVLNVSCSADRRTIVAAADERSFFEDADKCVEAQNALLNPAKRLSTELDWFPDTDEQNVAWIKQSIESGGRIPVGEFGIVSQLNAELYNLGFFDMTQPQQLVRFERTLCSVDRLYSRLDGKEIAQMLNQHRKTAHLAEVSVQEVEQELIQKRYRIRRVLSGCLEKMSDEDCTEKVLKIAQTYIEDNKGNPGVVLLDFVSQYELRIQPKIDALVERIDAKINFCKMRTGGVLDSALDDLMKEVAAWAALVKPMMICGKASGRGHEGTSAMGNKLRNLALYLHNEKEQTAGAAKLTEAMLGIFIYDRMFHNKLREEVKTLKKLSSQRQNAESLKEEIDRLLALINSAETWDEFEVTGKMEEVAFLVVQLNKKLKELAREDKDLHKIREVIGMAARSASVVLHNKFHKTQMAVDFMVFLMELFGDLPDLYLKMRKDKTELEPQLELIKLIGIPTLTETIPFQNLAGQSDDEWLLNKGKEHQRKKDYKNAYLYFKRAADMGNAEATNFVGFCYGSGYGVVKNYEEALIWYHKAVEKGNATAAYNISHAYQTGNGVPKDEKEAFKWAEKAAEMGHRDAATYVARCYLNGTGVNKDLKQALRFFEIGAKFGSTICMCQLAEIYDKGTGVEVDKEKSLFWYAKAAENGDRSACAYVGRMYETGEGTARNPEKAKHYYLLGSRKGVCTCTVAAAMLLAQSEDDGSKKELFELCNLAIQQGSKTFWIYQMLGKLYMNGQGTEKNFEKARENFRLANDDNSIRYLEKQQQDEELAQIQQYLNQKNEASNREAVRLCHKAIDRGSADPKVYRILGELYMIGSGTEKNYEKAREMFNRAGDTAGLAALEQRIREDKNNKKQKTKCIILAAILSLVIGTGGCLYTSYSTGMESIGGANNQIEASLMETFYYGKAVEKLQRAVSASSPATSLSKAKEYLSESGNLQDVNSYFSVIDKMESKDYRGALEIIESFPEIRVNKLGAENWKRILGKYISDLPMDDIQNRMSKLYLDESLYSAEYDEKAFDDELNWSVSEIQTLPERSGEVEIPSLQHIYDTYGKESAGKILIVKQCMDYPGKKQSSVVSFDLMEHLPVKYLPMSIDEVSYVIVVSYGYKDDPTGYYLGSTDALVETGIVKVYSLETDKQIYSSAVVEGDAPPMFYSYKGSPPAYLSGGKPDIYEEFLKALRKVMK